MTIERFFVHDVTILTPTHSDGRWGTETSWDDAAERSTRGWVAVRNNSTDPADPNRDVDVSQWVAVLPASSDLDESERLVAHGHTFDIVSHIIPGFTPENGTHHLEANLRLVEG